MSIDFEKRLEYIKKKLKNHKVIIYGAGKFFQEVIKNYDLSELNIIGITDRKFIQEDMGKTFANFPIILNSKFYTITDPEIYILVLLKEPNSILRTLKSKGYKNIYTLVSTSPQNITKKIKDFFNKHFKHQKDKNTFVLIKRDGSKVYNPKIKNLTVKMYGTNGYLELHEPLNFIEKQCCIHCSTNAKAIIGPNSRFRIANIYVGSDCTLTIGGYTTFARNLFLLIAGGNTISIGNDCMFSWDVIIRNDDGHTVYDYQSKQVLNPSKDITIGDHVWVGLRSIILKGAHIPSNTICAASSIINKQFEQENCIIAGSPAKIVKTGVNWDRRSPNNFFCQ